MKPIDFSDIYISGDLYYRTQLNFDRLEKEEYQSPSVYEMTPTWPGDVPGRAVLGLTLLARATHREPKYLDEIVMTTIDKFLNEKGYYGRILPAGILDEQQLSGNNWYLRGLIEYYLWKKDEKVYKTIKSIADNLLTAAKELFKTYPSDPNDRIFQEEVMGRYADMIKNWYLSTDIGCCFIMLDGASHAYQLLRNPELKEVVDEMIDTFLSLDVNGLNFQTHATLSALRGIIRHYETVGEQKLLDAAEKIYALYKNEGMTEHYSNYNWFGRPHWTEPCAVVDSFIAAVWLWKNTAKAEYLEDAHYILFNALGHGQRSNGGYGCDVCVGAQDEFLNIHDNYEAYWCCSMRGGEGHGRMVEYSYFQEEDTVIIPFYNENTACLRFSDGEVIINQATSYPVNGVVTLQVLNSTIKKDKILKLFIPSWVSEDSIKLFVNRKPCVFSVKRGFINITASLNTGDKIELTFDIIIRADNTINKNSIKGYHTFRHGSQILGMDNTSEAIKLGRDTNFTYHCRGIYQVENTDLYLSPINDPVYKTEEEAKKCRRQMLFKE